MITLNSLRIKTQPLWKKILTGSFEGAVVLLVMTAIFYVAPEFLSLLGEGYK